MLKQEQRKLKLEDNQKLQQRRKRLEMQRKQRIIDKEKNDA